MPLNEITRFKKELFKIVDIFFTLQQRYLSDNNEVFREVKIFRKYLNQFNKKYPHFDIVLEEEDLTSDDLKILLVKCKTKADLERFVNLEKVPLMAKKNKKYGCMQILINYEYLEDEINPAVDSICRIATQEIDNSAKPVLPKELMILARGYRSTQTSKNSSMVNRSR